MGPCPRCKRHVFLHERACPFCGARWLLPAAAASLFLISPVDAAPPPAPDPVGAWRQEEYGVPRPAVDVVDPMIVWNKTVDWKAQFGLSPVAKSWGEAKANAVVIYSVRVSEKGESPVQAGITHRLVKRGDDAIEFSVMGSARKPSSTKLATKAGIPAEAKVTSEGTETLEIAGKKLECAWKAYELPGRDFKVWTAKDAGVVKVVSGEETAQYAGTEEIKAAGKDHACAVWKTTFRSTEIREWRSDAVPGMVVKWQETVKDAENPKGEALSVTTIEIATIQPGR